MERFHWSLDSLVFRKNTVFGFGWLFHEDAEIETVSLQVSFAKSSERFSILVEHGKSRLDVAANYPQLHFAHNSGFLIYGSYPNHLGDILQVALVGIMKGGKPFSIGISADYLMPLDELEAKINSGLHDLPMLRGENVAEVGGLLESKDYGKTVLVIDHNMGGGANQYRDKLVAEKISQGHMVMIFTYDVPTLSYRLFVRNHRINDCYGIAEPTVLFSLARKIQFDEIVYNNAVSFANPEDIPQLILGLKAMGNPHVKMLLHDFFMVCPSHFLLNDREVFCNLPNLKECQTCLPKNQRGFATLYPSRDIVKWRELWYGVLSIADEIIVFSNSSLQLLFKAYPKLDASRVEVRPHSLKHIQYKPIQPIFVGELRIGVVGHIARHKGSRVIQNLSREIARRKLDIKLIVFGTIEANCDTSVVKETGHYSHEQLPELIRHSGANIFLFPSICPETFSYVVQELMELECPVACFDLGAPAERLRAYPKGLVLHDHNAEFVLDSLVEFHQRIYLSDRRNAVVREGDKQIGDLTQALIECYGKINLLQKAVANKEMQIVKYGALLAESRSEATAIRQSRSFRAGYYLLHPWKIFRRIWKSPK